MSCSKMSKDETFNEGGKCMFTELLSPSKSYTNFMLLFYNFHVGHRDFVNGFNIAFGEMWNINNIYRCSSSCNDQCFSEVGENFSRIYCQHHHVLTSLFHLDKIMLYCNLFNLLNKFILNNQLWWKWSWHETPFGRNDV